MLKKKKKYSLLDYIVYLCDSVISLIISVYLFEIKA